MSWALLLGASTVQGVEQVSGPQAACWWVGKGVVFTEVLHDQEPGDEAVVWLAVGSIMCCSAG